MPVIKSNFYDLLLTFLFAKRGENCNRKKFQRLSSACLHPLGIHSLLRRRISIIFKVSTTKYGKKENTKQYEVNHNKYCKRLGNWTRRSSSRKRRRKKMVIKIKYEKGVLLLHFLCVIFYNKLDFLCCIRFARIIWYWDIHIMN